MNTYMEFRTRIYNLKGSSGTFEYTSISNIAGETQITFRTALNQTYLDLKEKNRAMEFVKQLASLV